MPSAKSALVLLGVLVAPVLLSGCLSSVQGTKDWWAGQGGIVVKLTVLPADAPGQTLQDFSTLKIAIRSIVATPVGEVKAHAGVVYEPPYGIDLRTRMDDGPRVIMDRRAIETKTIEKVEVQLIMVEIKNAAGEDVPVCSTKGPSPVKPCFALEPTGRYILDKAHNPPRMVRAQVMTMEFPFAVIYNERSQEYFLQARSADVEAPVTFSKA